MSNSYRIRTDVGVDKSIKILLDQDFEYLEILSLKILQSQIYTRQCSDYGVVVGRVTANNGYGLPNCKVSVFIPLSDEDEGNQIISDLYPYKSLSQLNEAGYRYNLLPKTASYSAHIPTGSFFDIDEVLTNPSAIEVFDKYYKYTARTNDSGDYMIFGVPVGSQTIHIDIDLSDIGEFSLSPQDLIRMGVATEQQVAGTEFRSSANLNELPQIVSINRTIEIEPLWGQPEICSLGITRTDFDVTEEANINIQPTAIFMGSIISSNDKEYLRADCRPRIKQGELCSLIAGPGEILTIRQTIQQDSQGRPILETYELEGGGQVIDDNGTWLIDVPMNLDYIVTNEFGERIISDDPSKGIPTKGKYRFKIKWNQSPSLSESIKRGYFLVPNVREYGWTPAGTIDPLQNPTATPANKLLAKKSYSFSLDWVDYANPQSAIDCEDTFYLMQYNKVYTVSQLIDQYRRGTLPNRFVSIKNILDDSCESENNKFPTNDAAFRWDFLYLLYSFLMFFFKPFLITFVILLHILFFLYYTIIALLFILSAALIFLAIVAIAGAVAQFLLTAGPIPTPNIPLGIALIVGAVLLFVSAAGLIILANELIANPPKPLTLPLLLYDTCEFCDCSPDFEVGNNTSSSNPPILINVSGINIARTDTSYYVDLLSSNTSINDLSQIYTGAALDTVTPNVDLCKARAPQLISGSIIENNQSKQVYYFSTSLTLAERINLFNTKNKFYNQSPTNPGGGVNQMKVFVEPALNGNDNTKFHWDNLTIILCDTNSLSSIQVGQLLTFQDPRLSTDLNISANTTTNVFNNNAILGSNRLSSTSNNQISITSSIPNALGPSPAQHTKTTLYDIPPINTGDTNYHKFPTDIEYFQVITAMTYSQYSAQTSNQLPNSLYSRFLNNTTRVNAITNWEDVLNGNFKNEAYNTISPPYNFPNKPIEGLEDFRNLTLVFLVRGVDPYSTRVNVKYELGRYFGFTAHTAVTITGSYKLNIPIQGKWFGTTQTTTFTRPSRCVSHVNLNPNSNLGVDNYSKLNLFYNTYSYQPINFNSFNTNLHTYYSSLDTLTTPSSQTCLANLPIGAQQNTFGSQVFSTRTGISVKPTTSTGNISAANFPTNNTGGPRENGFVAEWNTQLYFQTPPASPSRPYFGLAPWNYGSTNSRGYFVSEIVEGGSLMLSSVNLKIPFLTTDSPSVTSRYIAPKYSSGFTSSMEVPLPTEAKLVMRSDRLPTSTQLQESGINSFALQNNTQLGIYTIPDDGVLQILTTNTLGGNNLLNDDPLPPNFISSLVESLKNCNNSRNLACYDFDPNTNQYIVNSGDCQKFDSRFIFENGCYKLVTSIFISIPKDTELIYEWVSRLSINFGACRNVFSHVFTNNWINGTLYAFSFRNDRLFDVTNNPFSEYCTDVIYLHPDTNNFYYRSSPYVRSPELFIGKEASQTSTNQRNLLYPTTLIDLGPRSDYIQELVYSDDYDGYVVNKLNTTSFGNVLDMFNLFIFSRLGNQSFISKLITFAGGDIFDYFTRERLTVDADYAQMISISSELGVTDFEPENYPDNSATLDPVFFNTGEYRDVIFGIFFSSDTQTRDYISPRRTIITPTVPPSNICAFNNINVFSQKVPMYQWKIEQNGSLLSLPNNERYDSIFGSQLNDWYTERFSNNSFFFIEYQNLDRTKTTSRYFRPNPTPFPIPTQNYTRDMRGYIFSFNSVNQFNGQYNYGIANNGAISQGHDNNNIPNDPNNYRSFTVGAPQHFYFGLKKGKSAFDRFSRKWINFEVVTD